jgi:hypothetical protein
MPSQGLACQRSDAENLLLLLADDFAQASRASAGIDRFLAQVEGTLAGPELTSADLAGLLATDDVSGHLETLDDTLASLRRSLQRLQRIVVGAPTTADKTA